MPSSKPLKKDDPLEGYRGRPSQDAYSELESEVNAFRSLANNDINLLLVQQVMKSDKLLADLNNESSTLKRLVTYVVGRIDESFKIWQLESDPTSDKALTAHRDVVAARLLIDWIGGEIDVGRQAEELLEGEADEQET